MKKHLRALALAAALSCRPPCRRRGELQLTMANGRVTLVAQRRHRPRDPRGMGARRADTHRQRRKDLGDAGHARTARRSRGAGARHRPALRRRVRDGPRVAGSPVPSRLRPDHDPARRAVRRRRRDGATVQRPTRQTQQVQQQTSRRTMMTKRRRRVASQCRTATCRRTGSRRPDHRRCPHSRQQQQAPVTAPRPGMLPAPQPQGVPPNPYLVHADPDESESADDPGADRPGPAATRTWRGPAGSRRAAGTSAPVGAVRPS